MTLFSKLVTASTVLAVKRKGENVFKLILDIIQFTEKYPCVSIHFK